MSIHVNSVHTSMIGQKKKKEERGTNEIYINQYKELAEPIQLKIGDVELIREKLQAEYESEQEQFAKAEEHRDVQSMIKSQQRLSAIQHLSMVYTTKKGQFEAQLTNLSSKYLR